MKIDRDYKQVISDLKHLMELGETFAYQNESIKIAIDALEKQLPKQVVYTPPNKSYESEGIYAESYCPVCDARLNEIDNNVNYCHSCGQNVNWVPVHGQA